MAFQGLALDDELARRNVNAWCGLVIIDTRHGHIVEWARFGESFVEMFNVELIPATRAFTTKSFNQKRPPLQAVSN